MLDHRSHRVFGCILVVAALACEAPTSPSREARRFAELASSPAWSLGAERDAAFLAAYRGDDISGFFQGGWRVARSADRWSTLWDTLTWYYVPPPPPAAVEFGTEMVVLAIGGATANSGGRSTIAHVTRQRDTVFVLVRVMTSKNCAGATAGFSTTDARVVPLAPPPTVFLVEQRVFDCRTMTSRPVW